MVERVQQQPLDQATLDRALVKLRSELYAGRSNSQASDAPICSPRLPCSTTILARINRLEDEFAKVTPALVQKTAQEYLRPTNRTIYKITPGKAAPAPAAKVRSPMMRAHSLTSRAWALCLGLVITLATVPHAQQAPGTKEPPPKPGTAKDFVSRSRRVSRCPTECR